MPTFPSSPTTDQEYTEGNATYIFTGSKWKLVTKPYSITGESITESGGAVSIDLSKGNFFEVDYSANTTITFDNPPSETAAFQVLLKSPVITGFDLTNAAYETSGVVFGSTGNPTAILYKPDGLRQYVLRSGSDAIYQYDHSIPWDTSSNRVLTGTLTVTSQEATPYGMFFDPTGQYLYVVGSTNDTVYLYFLSTPWDITTATYSTNSFNLSLAGNGALASPVNIFFSSNGSKMYIVDSTANRIYQYSLTPWSITTAVYDNKSFSPTAQDTSPYGMHITPDGLTLFVLGITNDAVYQYTLSTEWDISTATYANKSFSVASQETTPLGITFKPDGTKMYIVGSITDTVYQYSTDDNLSSITWPTNIYWEETTPPILDSNTQMLIDFYTSDDGVTYYAGKPERDIR